MTLHSHWKTLDNAVQLKKVLRMMKIGSCITEVVLGEKTAALKGVLQNLLLGMEITSWVSYIYGRIGNFCASGF